MDFSFSGVNLFSANPARTFAFYQALGLPVVEIPKEEGPWYGAVLALQEGPNHPVIWIWKSTPEEAAAASSRLVFQTGGRMEELYQRLRGAGFDCPPPKRAVWGGMEMSLTDPDGNQLLFL